MQAPNTLRPTSPRHPPVLQHPVQQHRGTVCFGATYDPKQHKINITTSTTTANYDDNAREQQNHEHDATYVCCESYSHSYSRDYDNDEGYDDDDDYDDDY